MFGVRHWLRRATRSFLARRGPSPVILMYHRVASPAYDPWQLAVRPERFADQLRSLNAERRLISMDALLDGLAHERLNGREVALTFDDGYSDNLTLAKPLLEQAQAPATVFITTGRLDARDEFWWDELAHLCLGGTSEVDVEVTIGEHKMRLRFEAQRPPVRNDWSCASPPRSERERMYLKLWLELRRLGEAARAIAMETLRQQLGAVAAAADNLPLRREDLPALVAGGLISVGGHARTHRGLSLLTSAEKHVEIGECKRELELLTPGRVSGFAYPFGDRDDEAMTLTRSAGYAWAVSTHAASVDRVRFDAFDLPRLQVLDWSGPELLQTLSALGVAA